MSRVACRMRAKRTMTDGREEDPVKYNEKKNALSSLLAPGFVLALLVPSLLAASLALGSKKALVGSIGAGSGGVEGAGGGGAAPEDDGHESERESERVGEKAKEEMPARVAEPD